MLNYLDAGEVDAQPSGLAPFKVSHSFPGLPLNRLTTISSAFNHVNNTRILNVSMMSVFNLVSSKTNNSIFQISFSKRLSPTLDTLLQLNPD